MSPAYINRVQEEPIVKSSGALHSGAVGFAVVALLSGCLSGTQPGDAAVRVGESDLGGVVTGANGPEAGVWVIAETTDLPTRFAKIVVTDERGRYLIPELPKASYAVWVRGYGLVDSEKNLPARGEPWTCGRFLRRARRRRPSTTRRSTGTRC